MGEIREPIQKRAVEKKSKLIKAAQRVFDDKGFHNTHIKDITSKAGISTGLFYKYFEDKKSIYLEVVRTIVDKEMEVVSAFRGRMNGNEDHREAIREYIENRLSVIRYRGIVQEFYTLGREEKHIAEFIDNVKTLYLEEIQGVLSGIWHGARESSIHVGAKLIWRTVYCNIIEIDEIDDEDLRQEYIDNLTELLSKYINK